MTNRLELLGLKRAFYGNKHEGFVIHDGMLITWTDDGHSLPRFRIFNIENGLVKQIGNVKAQGRKWLGVEDDPLFWTAKRNTRMVMKMVLDRFFPGVMFVK